MGKLTIHDALFQEDKDKVIDSVVKHNMGSHQLGEVATKSALLYDRGVDVADILSQIIKVYEPGGEEPVFNDKRKHFFRFLLEGREQQ